MLKSEVIKSAQSLLAAKWKCPADVFDHKNNLYLVAESDFFTVMTFGCNAVFNVNKVVLKSLSDNFGNTSAMEVFDTRNLLLMEKILSQYGKRLSSEQMKYLYSGADLAEPAGFNYRLFTKREIKQIEKNKAFSNALNRDSDVIAFAAFDGDKIVSIAGADDRMGDLWQIGVDTLPEYRERGLGSYVVNSLAKSIVNEGKMPYYTTMSVNMASSRTGLRAGFFPAWIEYTGI